jgi:hypothetical protein
MANRIFLQTINGVSFTGMIPSGTTAWNNSSVDGEVISPSITSSFCTSRKRLGNIFTINYY